MDCRRALKLSQGALLGVPQLTVEQIRRLIREAGCEPVERDTLYREVRRA